MKYGELISCYSYIILSYIKKNDNKKEQKLLLCVIKTMHHREFIFKKIHRIIENSVSSIQIHPKFVVMRCKKLDIDFCL